MCVIPGYLGFHLWHRPLADRPPARAAAGARAVVVLRNEKGKRCAHDWTRDEENVGIAELMLVGF